MIQLLKVPDRTFYTFGYLIFSLPLVVFLVFKVPAFQVPDEGSHFARAYQLTHGEFFPTKQPDPDVAGEYTVGGTVDPGLFEADQGYGYLKGHREAKVDPAKMAKADSIQWTSGHYYHTPNVSIYPFIHYLVPALGISLGQSFDLSIVDTLRLSRLMNSIFALLLISIALFSLRKGHGIFFVLLLMPMTISEIASTSQDATCFAAAALCVALFSQLNSDLPKSNRRKILFVTSLLLVAIGLAKPPWIGMSLFFLYFAFQYREEKGFTLECSIAFLGSFLAVVVWALYLAKYVSVPFGLDGVDYHKQALFILQSPFEWMAIFLENWRRHGFYYLTTFMANLGYLDTPFPYPYYYILTALTLFFSLFSGFLAEGKTVLGSLRKNLLVPSMIIVATSIGMIAVIFIMWAPLGSTKLAGMQGRYAIPLVLFIALGASSKALNNRSQMVYRCMILVFALSTLVVTPYVVLDRYY